MSPLALLVACAAGINQAPAPTPAAAPIPQAAPCLPGASEDWRRLASDADRARLRTWRDTWTSAVAAAPRAADAALLDSDRALAGPIPPFGTYRCRTYRPGAAGAMSVWTSCRVEEDKGRARFVVEGGVQRPVGHFYADTATRGVFLGTVLIGDEARPLRYGRDRLRDLAGLVDRIEPARWRVALPRSTFGGTLDLIELVPASAPPAAE